MKHSGKRRDRSYLKMGIRPAAKDYHVWHYIEEGPL